MRGYWIIFLVFLMGVYAVDDTPLVPSQIDGKVLDDGSPVIGATIEAYIDDGDCMLSDEAMYSSTVSLDSENDTFDGWYRISINPADYALGVTDVVLTVSHEGKSGTICVEDLEEGTRFDNDIHLTDSDADGDTYTSDVDCDDDNPSVNPGALEICNGIDDNCNDEIDEAADMCIGFDFESSDCNTDGNELTLDTYSFTSECVEGECTEKPETWQEQVESECALECNACLTNEDCGPAECLPDGCYDGVYRDYVGAAGECLECECVSECSYTEPYDSEICDGIDNDCDALVDEGCSDIGVACSEDWECVPGAECTEGLCAEREPYCDLYKPTALYTSWNLIGFPSCDDMPVEEALKSIEGKYGDVFVLEQGIWKNFNPLAPAQMNTLETLLSLQGIYINVSEDTILTVP